MRSIELFAGAGGLAIGMARAGFNHVAVVERDHDACDTFRENQQINEQDVAGWNLFEMDATKFKYEDILGSIDVVSGGPPCQPFSMGGKRLGHRDRRDMFPEAIRAIRELVPKAFVFENVKGLMSQNYAEYFGYLYLQLNYPALEKKRGENWKSHRTRLERHHTGSKQLPTYKVVYRVLNAADYGVPQKRERVFLVGIRSDLGVEWSFPEATHTEDQLICDQFETGRYWERHSISRKARAIEPAGLKSYISAVQKRADSQTTLKPWVTVRDALVGLPDPRDKSARAVENHFYIGGARSYPGHTGSHFDLPAKTLKAGDHGVPGGENMLRHVNGKVRYFTVREAARLQTFPDDYIFLGSWGRVMRQLGNAVPVQLAQVVGKSIASVISGSKSK